MVVGHGCQALHQPMQVGHRMRSGRQNNIIRVPQCPGLASHTAPTALGKAKTVLKTQNTDTSVSFQVAQPHALDALLGLIRISAEPHLKGHV